MLSELVKSVLCGLSDPHEMILFEDMLCGIEPFSEKIPTLESEKKKGQKRNFHGTLEQYGLLFQVANLKSSLIQ